MQEAPLFDDSAPLYAPIVPMTPDADLRRLGERLPRGIYLGSSSWNFPGWRGIVWGKLSSVTGLAERGLTAYAAYPVFRTAGIDRSYYRPLPTATYRQFADEVPDGFRFLVKAPQSVTDSQLRHPGTRRTEANPHYLDLKEAVETFVLPAAEGLGEKLGVLIFEMAQLHTRSSSYGSSPRDRYSSHVALCDAADQCLEVFGCAGRGKRPLAVKRRCRCALVVGGRRDV